MLTKRQRLRCPNEEAEPLGASFAPAPATARSPVGALPTPGFQAPGSQELGGNFSVVV